MVEIKEIGLHPNSKFRTFHPRIYIYKYIDIHVYLNVTVVSKRIVSLELTRVKNVNEKFINILKTFIAQ